MSLSTNLRKIVVELHVNPDDEENMPARQALELAIANHVMNPGERFEIVHDESGPS